MLFALPVSKWIGWQADRLTGAGAVLRDLAYPLLLMAVYAVSAAFIIKGTYDPFIYSNF